VLPAYLNLGDVREQQGNLPAAVEAWEELVRTSPQRAYLAFDRLERAYNAMRNPRRFTDLCRRLIDANPQDWRTRLALARHLTKEERAHEALDVLMEALEHNPHSLAMHQEVWRVLSALDLDPSLVARYVLLMRESVFYLDPHVCRRCRYRSTELLWQCPQCHEWNTFVEERIAAAKDTEAAMEPHP
jgi:lipopolysaccharide assembly protein B